MVSSRTVALIVSCTIALCGLVLGICFFVSGRNVNESAVPGPDPDPDMAAPQLAFAASAFEGKKFVSLETMRKRYDDASSHVGEEEGVGAKEPPSSFFDGDADGDEVWPEQYIINGWTAKPGRFSFFAYPFELYELFLYAVQFHLMDFNHSPRNESLWKSMGRTRFKWIPMGLY